MTRRICIVTGTRAEYGLLRGVIDGVHRSPNLQLQLLATGMHLSPEFGLTYREIEAASIRRSRCWSARIPPVASPSRWAWG